MKKKKRKGVQKKKLLDFKYEQVSLEKAISFVNCDYQQIVLI